MSVFNQEEEVSEKQIALCLIEVLYSVIKSVQRIETDAEFRRELDIVTIIRVTEDDELRQKFKTKMEHCDINKLFHNLAYELLRFIYISQRQVLLNLHPAMLSSQMLDVIS